MTDFNLAEHPHRRLNILTGDWVLVSPHRTQRPWQGQMENINSDARPAHDAECYLCSGNQRANGAINSKYTETFSFDNDFGALLSDTPDTESDVGGLLVSHTESGICRVACFSPRHDLTLAEMSSPEIRKVVDLWHHEYQTLGAQDKINYVQIFENKGSVMGCSNPHPHGQIWAQHAVPCEPARELVRMKLHFDKTGRALLQDYLKLELELQERIVCSNDSFVVLVPFWATWPFEVMILPRRQIASLLDMTEREKTDFAGILRSTTAKYDNLFQVSFPYSSGIHQAPTDGKEHPECTFHMHFYPPLLRSATVKKFMVGYEMLGGAQRDITAEASARYLRDLSDVHYKQNKNSKNEAATLLASVTP